MTQQTIAVGAVANDGLGDPLRDAYIKCNDNFTELYGLNFILEASNITALRNGTNAQMLRVYNTYTDASNYERAAVGWSSNVLTIGLQIAGTGLDSRNVRIVGPNNAGGVQVTNANLYGLLMVDAGAGGIRSASGGVYGWAAGEATFISVNDTGFSRTAAAEAALGNGTAGNATGTLKLAKVVAGLGSIGSPSITFAGDTTTGIYNAGTQVNVTIAGTDTLAIAADALWFKRNVAQISMGAAADVNLFRDAANVLAQRNGTTAQAFNVYNTYTDASNYERASIKWNSNVLEIGPVAAGTGTLRQLTLTATNVLAGTKLSLSGFSNPFAWAYLEQSNGVSWDFWGYAFNGLSMNGQNQIVKTASNGAFGFSSTTVASGGADTTIARAAANSIQFAGGAGPVSVGAATSRTAINKAITAIADNTATAVLTVTVPNGAHSAAIRVRLTGSLGAGGAIGANESTQDAEYMINIARTTGVNAVATIGAVVGQAAAASVAGADNAATTATLSAISGAVGATNTFTINVTIARSGGSSTNHTCLAFAELLNANATGVTIA